MVKIIVENFSDEDLRKIYMELNRKENWDSKCEMCKMPEILHKGVCTRTTEAGTIDYQELFISWDIFRSKMELIRKEQEDEEKETRKNSDLLTGITKIAEAQNASMAVMIEPFKGSNRGTTKLVKPAKVPGWTKEMKLEVYLKALEVWMETNKDVSEGVRFQDVIESLKMNKEIEGLGKYVGEMILTKLDRKAESKEDNRIIEGKVYKNKDRGVRRIDGRMAKI